MFLGSKAVRFRGRVGFLLEDFGTWGSYPYSPQPLRPPASKVLGKISSHSAWAPPLTSLNLHLKRNSRCGDQQNNPWGCVTLTLHSRKLTAGTWKYHPLEKEKHLNICKPPVLGFQPLVFWGVNKIEGWWWCKCWFGKAYRWWFVHTLFFNYKEKMAG